MNKNKLRQELKARLSNVSNDDVRVNSRQIFEQLKKHLNDITSSSFHIYQSLPDLHEVETIDIVPWLARNAVAVFTPTYTQENKPEFISPENILSFNQQLYPYKQPIRPNEKIDIFIVPLLGFDAQGNRLGRGGGFYDIMLAKYPQATKIGLAFEVQKMAALPHEAHDVRLSTVITEAKTYNF